MPEMTETGARLLIIGIGLIDLVSFYQKSYIDM